jgi:hemoglobin
MQSNSRFYRPMLLGVVFSLLLTTTGSMSGRAQEKSLYERVGGYNALAAVVDDFIGRLVADKQFEKFFVGHSTDSKKRIRQHILDQFVQLPVAHVFTPGEK